MTQSKIWFFLGVMAFLFVVFSHFVLQNYLMLQPCEQCVYIRYAFIILGFGCLIARFFVLRYVGIGICVYALIRGSSAAFSLIEIQKALKSETFIFGLNGCSLNPKFDFNLPLDVWMPKLFAPSGFCGIDTPMLNGIQTLLPLQEKLIALYAEGWYLIPMLKFGTMAECALFIFITYGVGIGILILVNFIDFFKKVK
ncbi:disulfide bond formation protein B [uncultured Helicobacter sp.]|uniref:disulfide bond formation protein B n=1 Tax=uncultured Helicobacter sp. TaxID=175537 RepID=UPI0026158F1B|nr:disulfide bond formation protein B [uncultured Helicobacter sp.]